MSPVTGVVRESWTVYRGHVARLLPPAFVIYALVAIVQVVLVGTLHSVGALLSAVLSIIALFLLHAALVGAVADIRAGRASGDVGETLRAARPALGRVAAVSILGGIAIGVGLFAFIVPGLWLLTMWCLIVPVVVLEGAGVGAAFGRSRELVRGHGWSVFGVLICLVLVEVAVALVVGIALFAGSSALREGVANVVVGTLVSPFVAVVLTMLYFRLLAVHSGAQPVPSGLGRNATNRS